MVTRLLGMPGALLLAGCVAGPTVYTPSVTFTLAAGTESSYRDKAVLQLSEAQPSGYCAAARSIRNQVNLDLATAEVNLAGATGQNDKPFAPGVLAVATNGRVYFKSSDDVPGLGYHYGAIGTHDLHDASAVKPGAEVHVTFDPGYKLEAVASLVALGSLDRACSAGILATQLPAPAASDPELYPLAASASPSPKP